MTQIKKKLTMMVEYFQRQSDLEKKYGPRSVVLYQCGGFYEVYEEKICTCDDKPGPSHPRPCKKTSAAGRACSDCGCVAPPAVPIGQSTNVKDMWNVAQPSKNRWWMVGFPVGNAAAFQRNLGVLIRNGWTVAVYDQRDVDPSSGRLATKQEKTRVLRRIYSSGTCFGDSGIVSEDNPGLRGRMARTTMAMYFNRCKIDPLFHNSDAGDDSMIHYEIGIAIIEIERGVTSCGSVFTTDKDRSLPFARLRELLSEHEPTELLIVSQGLPASQVVAVLRQNGVVLPDKRRLIVRAVNNKSVLANRQAAVFTKVFACGKVSGIPIAQRLGIACDHCAATALSELLLFVDDHDPTLVRNLVAPTVLLDGSHLIVHTTTLRQLNILAPRDSRQSSNNGAPASLLDVIDHCITLEGKKLLRGRICRPSAQPAEIVERLDRVGALMSPGATGVQAFLKNLKGLGKLVGRVRGERLRYSHLPQLRRASTMGLALLSDGLKDACVSSAPFKAFVEKTFPHRHRVALASMAQYLDATYELKKASRINVRDCEQTSCFMAGVDEKIDQMVRGIADGVTYLRDVSDTLRRALPSVKVGNRKKRISVQPQDVVVATVATSDMRRFSFELTNNGNRARKQCSTRPRDTIAAPLVVSNAITDTPTEEAIVYPDTLVSPAWDHPIAKTDTYNGHIFVMFKWQVPVRDAMMELHADLVAETQAKFRHSQNTIREEFLPALEALLSLLAEIDVGMSSATIARRYAYTRPKLIPVDRDDGSRGKMIIRGLRHPIIERLDPNTSYVANDISFDEASGGYLVHGVNAAGKSSLMKSAGIAVIMAQAGLYVAAESMSLVPYKQLFTRITKEDDLFGGMSSFQVEMIEVGDILRRAGRNSLVIGDELCSGTETTSAVAIVGASVMSLRERGTHFLFATHLHELSHLPDIQSDPGIRSVHMRVDIGKDGQLTYARVLTPGQGPASYGIEACVGFGLPKCMIQLATKYRSLLESPVASVQESKHNSGVMRETCKFPKCNRRAVDVHHLVHQSEASPDGFLSDGRHKNDRSNLLPLCKIHHDQFHRPDAKNVGASWVHTSHGRKIQLEDPRLVMIKSQ